MSTLTQTRLRSVFAKGHLKGCMKIDLWVNKLPYKIEIKSKTWVPKGNDGFWFLSFVLPEIDVKEFSGDDGNLDKII